MKEFLEELCYLCMSNNNYQIVFVVSHENYDKIYSELVKVNSQIKLTPYGHKIQFGGWSNINLVYDSESARGLRCNYLVIDDKVSHTNFRCIYEPMLVKHDDINIMWTFVQV